MPSKKPKSAELAEHQRVERMGELAREVVSTVRGVWCKYDGTHFDVVLRGLDEESLRKVAKALTLNGLALKGRLMKESHAGCFAAPPKGYQVGKCTQCVKAYTWKRQRGVPHASKRCPSCLTQLELTTRKLRLPWIELP